MATTDEKINTLRKQFETIRDEKNLQANTATRIGNAFLALLSTLGSFLSKESDDSAVGLITFLKGIVLGKDFNITENGIATLASILAKGSNEGLNGFRITTDAVGNGHIQTDYFEVLKKAIIHSLEIREYTAIGGNLIISGARGKITKVENVYDERGKTVVSYKCYLKNDDGTMRTLNTWSVGMQAICSTFNVVGRYTDGLYIASSTSNQYYWRVVTEVGQKTDEHEAYIVLSNVSPYFDDGSTVPMQDDTVMALGYNSDYYHAVINPNDSSNASFPYDLTGAMILESTALSSGMIKFSTRVRMLDLITSFSLANAAQTVDLSRGKVKIESGSFEWLTPHGDIPAVVYYGNYDNTKSYSYYSEVDYGGSKWICICKDGAPANNLPSDDSKYWLREKSSAVYTSNLSDYADTIVVDADGNVDGGLWFEVGNMTDSSGKIIYESDGVTPKKVVQYRLHSAIFAKRDNDYLIYSEPTDSSGNYVKPGAGHYTVSLNFDGCIGKLENGTIYIYAINHIKDGISGTNPLIIDANGNSISDDNWKDSEYELMRSIHQCRVLADIDCEGRQTIHLEMPVTIKHTDASFIVSNLDDDSNDIVWNTVLSQYTIGKTFTTKLTSLHNAEQLAHQSVSIAITDENGNASTLLTGSFSIDAINKFTKISIAPTTQSTNFTDGKYYVNIHSIVKYAGASYEKNNILTVFKKTNAVSYKIVPSTTTVKGNWNTENTDIISYTPSTFTVSVIASDGVKAAKTLSYAEWNAIGLTLTVNGTIITDSVNVITVSGSGSYECILSLNGTIVDREVIGYMQDGKVGGTGENAMQLVCKPETIVVKLTYVNGVFSGSVAAQIQLQDGKNISNITTAATLAFSSGIKNTTSTDANGNFTINYSDLEKSDTQITLLDGTKIYLPIKNQSVTATYKGLSITIPISVDTTAYDASETNNVYKWSQERAKWELDATGTLTEQKNEITVNADGLKNVTSRTSTLENDYSEISTKYNNISLKVGSWKEKRNLLPNSIWHVCVNTNGDNDVKIASWDIAVTAGKNYVLSVNGKGLLIQLIDTSLSQSTPTAALTGDTLCTIATTVLQSQGTNLTVVIYARNSSAAIFNYAQLEETTISPGTENANTVWSQCKSDKDVSDNILTGTRDLSSGTSVSGADKTYIDDNGNEFAAYYSDTGDEIYITDNIELSVGRYTFSFLAKADIDAQTFLVGLYNSSNTLDFAFSFVASNGTSSATTNAVTIAMSKSWVRYYITYNVTSPGTGYFQITPTDTMWFCTPKLTKCGAWDAWTNAIGYDNLFPSGFDIYRDFIAAYANHFKFYDNQGKDLACFDEKGLTSKQLRCKNKNGVIVHTINEDDENGLVKRYYPDPEKNNATKLLLMEEAYVYDASHNCIGIRRIYYNRDGTVSYVMDESEEKMTGAYIGWKSEEAYESTTRYPGNGTTDDGATLSKNCYKNTFVSNDANSKTYNGNVEVDALAKTVLDGLGTPTWYTGYLLDKNVTLSLSSTIPVIGVYFRTVYHYVEGKLTETLTNKTTKVYNGNFSPSL